MVGKCVFLDSLNSEPPTSNTLNQYKYSVTFHGISKNLSYYAPIMLILKPKLQYFSMFFQYFASKISTSTEESVRLTEGIKNEFVLPQSLEYEQVSLFLCPPCCDLAFHYMYTFHSCCWATSESLHPWSAAYIAEPCLDLASCQRDTQPDNRVLPQLLQPKWLPYSAANRQWQLHPVFQNEWAGGVYSLHVLCCHAHQSRHWSWGLS